MESQSHGFELEEFVKNALKQNSTDIECDTSGNRLSKWDVSAFGGYPLSIKMIRDGGNIDLGSAPRNWAIDEEFLFIIITYTQKGDFKHIISADPYYVPIATWIKMRGNLTLEEVIEAEKHLKESFPKGKHKEARIWYKTLRREWEEAGKINKIIPTCKVDSKDQRRWQCTVTREDFHSEFGPLSMDTSINGCQLPEKIESPARERKSKNKFDQFYTKPEIAQHCVTEFQKFYKFSDYDIVLEPSAGTGSFYNLLPETQRCGVDIDPKIDGLAKLNFFDFKPIPNKSYATIGNPPFGKNSAAAIEFFNHSAKFSNVIAFIIPKTFRKSSVINRLDNKFHLVHDEELPLKSFVFEGNDYEVPCLFQIWEKKDLCREKKIIIRRHEDFKFVSSLEEADFGIQRVGGGAGNIKTIAELKTLSPLSHLYISASSPEVKAIFEKIDWNTVKFNTAGNPSISPSEIFELYIAEKRKMPGYEELIPVFSDLWDIS